MSLPKFSKADEALLYDLASKLTGTCQDGKFRHQVIITNVARRMAKLHIKELKTYLARAKADSSEYQYLVSALTIHTTAWFREAPHFEKLEQDLLADRAKLSGRKFRAFSAACSTGEEVYTCALILESIRQSNPGFEYEVVGADIDPISVKHGKRGIYNLEAVAQIPQRFKKFLLKGSGKTEGTFTLSKEIRSRCKFGTASLTNVQDTGADRYDLIFCRNVLIYFSPQQVEEIVNKLLGILNSDGILCLGHSEALDASKYRVRSLGNARYAPLGTLSSGSTSEVKSPAKVLVIDDSATIRGQLMKLFGKSPLLATSVGSADEATKFLDGESVDLITLDLHMPGQSGQSWLRAQREKGMRIPVIILSGASPAEAVEVLGALESGAQDYIDKSSLHKNSADVLQRIKEIAEQYRSTKIKRKGAVTKSDKSALKLVRPDLILIGASTGGTEALSKMLKGMPANCPPVVVTQHITPAFAGQFAKRLASVSGLTLAESKDGVELQNNHLYMAWDDYHVGVAERAGKYVLKVSHDGPVNRHRPSVDYLFRTGAAIKTSRIMALILTGMGADGAQGLLELQRKGCMTMAQDEESCVVFGMPKEAIALGAAGFIGNPSDLREQLNKVIKMSAEPQVSATNAVKTMTVGAAIRR